MASSSDYRLGSIPIARFDPSVETEIRKTRPALVISGTLFNERRRKVDCFAIYLSSSSRSSDFCCCALSTRIPTKWFRCRQFASLCRSHDFRQNEISTTSRPIGIGAIFPSSRDFAAVSEIIVIVLF
jgi:hypothetical protein